MEQGRFTKFWGENIIKLGDVRKRLGENIWQKRGEIYSEESGENGAYINNLVARLYEYAGLLENL